MINDQRKELLKLNIEKMKLYAIVFIASGSRFWVKLLNNNELYWELEIMISLIISCSSIIVCYFYNEQNKKLINEIE